MRRSCLVNAFAFGASILLAATADAAKPIKIAPPIRDPNRIAQRYVKDWKAMREQNVVMQQYDYSCGAAALTTLLRYYWGDDVTEEQVLNATLSHMKPDDVKDRMKNGLAITDLRLAAEELGYPAALGSQPMSKLMEAKAPAIVRIIQNEYEHFVVYRGVVEDRVFLADPIRGNIRMSVNKFACAWLPPGKREGVLLVVAKKGVTKLPENAPLTLHYPWCRDAAPEHQAARRGLYLKSLGPVLQPVIPITR